MEPRVISAICEVEREGIEDSFSQHLLVHLGSAPAIKNHELSLRATWNFFQWSNPLRTLNYNGRRQPLLLVLWTLLFIGYFPTVISDELGSSSRDPECVTCAREQTLSILKEEELRQWRIETIKQQILDRLEMEDRPKFKTKETVLPRGTILPYEDHIQPIRQIILYPSKIHPARKNSSRPKRDVLKFHITDEMLDAVLHSAVLWTAHVDEHNDTQVSWQHKDVTGPVDHQIVHYDRHRKNKYLSLSLQSKYLRLDEARPYLVIQLDPSHRESSDGPKTRKRRSTPMCSATVNECCREQMFISFADIGWADWISAPHGFHAYYCRGSCRTPTAALSSESYRISFIQRMLSRGRVPPEARPHLAPCCVPTRLSSLTVFYSDRTDVVKQRVLPDMITESCGCAL